MAQRPSPVLANAVAPGVRVERIEPLQRRVERNRWRFIGFMVAFTSVTAALLFLALGLLTFFVVLLVVGALAETAPMLFGAPLLAVLLVSVVAAWAWALSRLLRSEASIVRRLDARIPPADSLRSTRGVLRDMSIAAGLPHTPPLYVIETPKVNAFVVGRSPKRVRIGITRGFVERIELDEQRAVFANLIARVLTLDTLWATAVSALMGPIWAMREYDLKFEPRKYTEAEQELLRLTDRAAKESDWRAGSPLYGLAVIITEVLAWYHRKAAWTAAEKADAEGMLLLKDPRSMLRAIEHVLERDNHVPTAGDAYSQVFFCWAGFGFAPEQDPEMRRVARLRETLGAEGAAYVPRPNVPGWPTAPRAPRLDLADEIVARTAAGEAWETDEP